MPAITFTYDLEDHSHNIGNQKRYTIITEQLLDFLESRGIRCTVFVLGELAGNNPSLVKKIAGRGHEIGFHTYRHKHLTHENPDNFRQETDYSKKMMEDLVGAPITGFRAPAFSLTRDSVWVLDILKTQGFTYSSSVLPVKNPINGFPGVPEEPFYWPNGILEIPAPVARFGPLAIPFLGGIYLRYLPLILIEYMLNSTPEKACLWTYCHPHDFDNEEKFYVIRGTSFMTSLLLWMNRKNTFSKLQHLINNRKLEFQEPFAEMIASGKFRNTTIFDPGNSAI
jgi:polysaccharide deacetylase family protein (PEP-CTERM system associated)